MAKSRAWLVQALGQGAMLMAAGAVFLEHVVDSAFGAIGIHGQGNRPLRQSRLRPEQARPKAGAQQAHHGHDRLRNFAADPPTTFESPR